MKTVDRLAALNSPRSLNTLADQAISYNHLEVDLLIAATRNANAGADPRVVLGNVLPRIRRIESQANTAWAQIGARDCV
jgi:hypothetical protein